MEYLIKQWNTKKQKAVLLNIIEGKQEAIEIAELLGDFTEVWHRNEYLEINLVHIAGDLKNYE